MKRWKTLAAALALVAGTGAVAASAKAACAGARGCKAHVRAHTMRRPVYGEGRALGPSLLPPPPLPTLEVPTPTLPPRRYLPGVAPPSPFLPNDLPPTYLPQKL